MPAVCSLKENVVRTPSSISDVFSWSACIPGVCPPGVHTVRAISTVKRSQEFCKRELKLEAESAERGGAQGRIQTFLQNFRVHAFADVSLHPFTPGSAGPAHLGQLLLERCAPCTVPGTSLHCVHGGVNWEERVDALCLGHRGWFHSLGAGGPCWSPPQGQAGKGNLMLLKGEQTRFPFACRTRLSR